MTNRIADISLRKAATIAGFGLLVMTIFAVFALYFIFQKLIVPEDAATTAKNILVNEIVFRTGICSFVIVIICDILVVWALLVFVKPVNNSLSLFTAWFRLVYSIIFGIALVHNFSALQLLSGADYLNIFGTDQLHAEVMLFLNAFNDGWAIGYIFFGLHLAFLGYLVFKSDYMPGILSILLVVAGISYLIDYFSKFLFLITL